MLERDQAGTLRKMMEDVEYSPRSIDRRSTRVISITSGKGGVGKSSVAANLAVAAGKMGQRVLLLDGDFGLANLDILFDIKPQHTLYDVLHGSQNLEDILLEAAPGVDILPASSGMMEMTNLGIHEKAKLLEQMQSLEDAYDLLIIDTGAGISDEVAWLNSSASEVVVVATPDPTSITDAYALIKVLNQKYKMKDFKLLVNQAKNEAEALKVYQKISAVSDRFLHVGIDYWGCVLWDQLATESVRMRKPMLTAFPDGKASKNFMHIAQRFSKQQETHEFNGNLQFFWRALVGHAKA